MLTSDSRFQLTETRRHNRNLNHKEFAERATTLASRPLALFIELTKNCNLKCPMCRSGETYSHEFNLDRRLFEQLADELFQSALLVDLRGWGESTMLPHFAETVDIALKYRAQLRLVTNGQLNRVKIWEKLMAAHAIIAVSCDSADAELFRKLRGGGRLPALKRTVSTLVRLRERYNAPDSNLELITVASGDNLPGLSGIVTMAADLGVKKVTVFPLQSINSDPSHLHHHLAAAQAAYSSAASRARAEGIELRLGAAPDVNMAIPDKVKMHPCMHPWSYAYIDYAGRVGFCDHLIGNPVYTFGSLSKMSFEEIWNSEQWVSLRKSHVAGILPDRFFPCRWCFKNRYVDFEDRLHPDYAARIVATNTVEQVTSPLSGDPTPPLPWM